MDKNVFFIKLNDIEIRINRDIDGKFVIPDELRKYIGIGTALKPAVEPIVMARKPIEESTVADNVLKYGTGGINIDESRIGFVSEADKKESTQKNQHVDFGTKPLTGNFIYGDYSMVQPKNYNPPGRWPANLILDEEAGKLLDEQSGVTKSGKVKENKSAYGGDSNTGFLRGVSTAENQYGDSGGASRFFYCPKVSKRERNEGLGGIITNIFYELNDGVSDDVKNQIKNILKL